MTTKKTTKKTTMFRLLAVLVCAALISTGCAAPDEAPPSTEIAAREDPRITALRGSIGDYDPALGTLGWDGATVRELDDDVTAVAVPVGDRGAPRWLLAKVEEGARGPTFRVAVVELGTDPTTGDPIVTAVFDADGTARAMPGTGDFVDTCYNGCMTQAGWNCQADCAMQGNPQGCWFMCTFSNQTPCLVGCVVAWLVTWLWAF